jgi:hypothetical protein
VSGSLDADVATYSKVTKLTVNSAFGVTVDLPALEDLIVTTGGAFTGTTLGTVDSEKGIGLEIAPASSTIPAGSVTVTQINSLRTSTIQGSLTATGFTLYAPTPALTTPSELKVAAKGSINGISFPAQVVVTALAANSVTIDDFTVPEDLGLTIPGSTPGPAKTLVIGAGKTFTYDGQVNIAAGGSLVLETTSTTSVGKIAGTGSIIAGLTTIKGAWEAVAETADPGTLTIGSTANGATITADGAEATGLKASAAGATITQAGGTSGNTISIGAATKLTLGGTTTAPLGAILLKSAGTNPAKLTLAADSIVLVGAGTGGTALGAATTVIVGGKTIVKTGLVKEDFEVDGSDFLVQLGGTTAGTITAPASADNDVLINSTAVVTGS